MTQRGRRGTTGAPSGCYIARHRAAADDGAPPRSFERYCRGVEATAAWGGQLELRALAHVLRRRIVVYSAHLPTVEMGEEYRVDDDAPPLRVAYQQHAYGLGEHYNSVAPVAGVGDAL